MLQLVLDQVFRNNSDQGCADGLKRCGQRDRSGGHLDSGAYFVSRIRCCLLGRVGARLGVERHLGAGEEPEQSRDEAHEVHRWLGGSVIDRQPEEDCDRSDRQGDHGQQDDECVPRPDPIHERVPTGWRALRRAA